MNRLFLLAGSLVVGVFVPLIGCGGSSTVPGSLVDAAVDGASATTSGTTGGTAGTTGGSSGAGATAGTGGNGNTGTSGTAGGTGGGTGGTTGGGTGDAGQMLVADGGSPPNAGPGGSTSNLPCGNAQCSIPAQQCCVIANPNPPPNFSYACYAGSCPVVGGGGGGGGGNGAMTTALSCSGAANCPASTVCCVTQTQSGAASSCAATCGQNGAQLCDPNAASSGCPQGMMCSSQNIGDWGLPNGFATCGGVGN